MRYVPEKDRKEFLKDIKSIYKAGTKDMAEYHVLSVSEKWKVKTPFVIKSWNNN